MVNTFGAEPLAEARPFFQGAGFQSFNFEKQVHLIF
jgi:hypothetical protein